MLDWLIERLFGWCKRCQQKRVWKYRGGILVDGDGHYLRCECCCDYRWGCEHQDLPCKRCNRNH